MRTRNLIPLMLIVALTGCAELQLADEADDAAKQAGKDARAAELRLATATANAEAAEREEAAASASVRIAEQEEAAAVAAHAAAELKAAAAKADAEAGLGTATAAAEAALAVEAAAKVRAAAAVAREKLAIAAVTAAEETAREVEAQARAVEAAAVKAAAKVRADAQADAARVEAQAAIARDTQTMQAVAQVAGPVYGHIAALLIGLVGGIFGAVQTKKKNKAEAETVKTMTTADNVVKAIDAAKVDGVVNFKDQKVKDKLDLVMGADGMALVHKARL